MRGYGEGQMIELGGFGEEFSRTVPALVGGGSAAVIAVGTRGLAPAGTWFSRHAGVIGAGGGMAIAYFAKQGSIGIATALLVGLTLEGIEQITRLKMTT